MSPIAKFTSIWQHTVMDVTKHDIASGILTIDLKALQENYQNIRDYCQNYDSNSAVAAVVKANGYGLGMAEVSTALYNVGCRLFYVATPNEGVELRKLLDDIDIFILDGLFKNAEKIYQTHNLIPCLSSDDQILSWYAHGQAQGTQLPCVLHLNTGINRLGLNLTDYKSVQPVVTQGLNIRHVMSHFASADVPGDTQNLAQIAEIKQIIDYFPMLDCSFGNSPAIAYEPLQKIDFKNSHIARPGVALCGVKTTKDYPIKLKPVVSLHARVLQISTLATGDMVGYGHQFIAIKPMRIAIIAAGYADGMFRSLATSADNDGYFYAKGHKLPILGRVSMDMMVVDISDVPLDELHQVHFVEIIGENISLAQVANWAGTIEYEILTNLGKRFLRNYLNG